MHGSEGTYPRLVSLFVSKVAKNVFISFLRALYNYLVGAFQTMNGCKLQTTNNCSSAVFRSCDVLPWKDTSYLLEVVQDAHTGILRILAKVHQSLQCVHRTAAPLILFPEVES